MIVTSKLTLDLARRGVTPRVDAVQDDKYSRDLEITLLSGGEAWAVPEGAAVAVSYVKPDGTVGKYDTLPDGTAAWSAAGNVLTVALAPQVLTCPGLVSMHVHISTGEAVLSTFEIQLVVQRNPAINAESEDYINMSGFLQIPGQVGQIIQVSAVDADGKVTALEAVDMPGGESEANVLVVVFTTANLVTGTASHSASEISSAAEAGKLIWGRFSGDVISGTPIDYLGFTDGKALFGITTTNVDFHGNVGATLIYVDDTKTITITRGAYIMVPAPTESDIGKTLAVDAAYSVAWQTPSGGVNPVQKTEDMTQSVGVDESGGLWTTPGGGNALDIDATLAESGKAADAKAVGDALANKQPKGYYVKSVNGNTPDASGNVTVESGGTSAEIPTALPNPHKLTFSGAVEAEYDGSEPVEVVIPESGSGGEGNKSPVVLGELTLEEDITGYGSIIVPLRDNPFNYSQILITISAQQIEGGQFNGILYGGGKRATATHLNTVFSTTESTTVSTLVTFFADNLFAMATKVSAYQWTSTTQYSFEYTINADESATDNMLKFINSSAKAGANFKVEGVPK